MNFSRILVGGLTAVLMSACGKPAAGAVAEPHAADATTVVATWGDKKLTLAEVDEALGQQLSDLEKRKFQMRAQKIDELAIQALVKADAQKQGINEEQWLKTNIDAKVAPVADSVVAKFYEENKAQMPPGSTLEAMAPQIQGFLSQDSKREVAKAAFEALKKQVNFKLNLAEPRAPRRVVEAKGPSRGPDNAKVTIVEFSDFQCPFCTRAKDTVEQVMEAYAGKVRLVFRQFPLEFHAQAPKAAEAALCAHEQGKFWPMHDELFKNQQKLMPQDLKAHAQTIGLDAAKFATCLDSGKFAAQVEEDLAAGKKYGVSGTPAFFINGVSLSGAQPLEEFKKVIDAELAAK